LGNGASHPFLEQTKLLVEKGRRWGHPFFGELVKKEIYSLKNLNIVLFLLIFTNSQFV
jgi:hypothetical protein